MMKTIYNIDYPSPSQIQFSNYTSHIIFSSNHHHHDRRRCLNLNKNREVESSPPQFSSSSCDDSEIETGLDLASPIYTATKDHNVVDDDALVDDIYDAGFNRVLIHNSPSSSTLLNNTNTNKLSNPKKSTQLNGSSNER